MSEHPKEGCGRLDCKFCTAGRERLLNAVNEAVEPRLPWTFWLDLRWLRFRAWFHRCPECGARPYMRFQKDSPRWADDKVAQMLGAVGNGRCDRLRKEGRPMSLTPDIERVLAELGREDRADEACSICHASVRPDRRDRHMDWHASLLREVEGERLPQVYGARLTPPGSSEEGSS